RMVARQLDRVKGVIGPWGHHFPHRAMPEPAINWLHHCTRWFDRWLKGIENDVMSDPPLRLFVTEPFVANGRSEGSREGRWIGIEPQVLEKAPEMVLGLGENGRLGANWSDGQIEINSPASLGMAGGEFMPMGWGIDLPSEQRLDDALSVCFETEPLEEAIEVIGKPRLQLTLKSTKPSGFLVARLCDVAPNGASTRIAIGAYELSTRAGTQPHSPLSEDGKIQIEIELGGIAHRFEKGQRMRIALSNAYWPMMWPSNQEDVITLFTNGATLSLPTPTEFHSYSGFQQGDGCEPLSKTAISSPVFERELIRDMPSGQAAYRITDAAPRVQFDDHKIETWNATTRVYRINEHQPTSAEMTIQRDIEVSRGKWDVKTRIEATIESDSNYYYSDVTLTAQLNGEAIVKRTFENKSPRFPNSTE
ncbi:MAG: CocE/NonD family hydrolase C-terminal non-catalytic domain-containing protein, partial [Chloroflexota bacterium]